MGWRDRVKKSFGDSEYIGEGIQNSKKIEKERKEGSKTTFIYYPHNPQNPQNRENEGEKPKTDQENTPSTVKDQSTPKPTPAQNIPAPEPAGMGPEYDRLWNQAWTLADWIDDPAAAPIEDRRAKLPELDDLRERMAAICSNGTNKPVPTAEPDTETSPPGTWMPWKSSSTTTPDTCPAMCKRSGKCYAGAYFKGKPSRAKDCEPETCIHISSERENHDSQTT